jgi:biopolymer transport protein ExbD
MIDVVFQLLVFFIATTRFVSGENVLRMDLPARTAAAPATPQSDADPFAYVEDALRVEVGPGGAVRARAPVAAARTAADLRALLERARRDGANPAGALPPDFPIVIAPLPGATWEDAIAALNAAAGAGYRRVSFDRAPAERVP